MAGRVVNLERGMPTVDGAMARLGMELQTARAYGASYVKLVHGYGSTGRGGAIKAALGPKLRRLRQDGRICAFVPGEEFSPFNPDARAMLVKCPELRRDSDFAMGNHGITVVLL